MKTETIETAAQIVDPRDGEQYGGTLEEALIAMVAYAGELFDPDASYYEARHNLARALANSDQNRVAEIAAAALLRLHELAPVDGPTQSTRVPDGTPAAYTEPRPITIRSVRDGDEIATWTDGHLIGTLGGLANAGEDVTWRVVDFTHGWRGVHELTSNGRTWRLNSFGDVVIRERVAETEPTHDPSQPTPPFPLAEGDKVTLTVDATVYALPDQEDEPGEGYYVFAFEVAGERQLLSLTQDEVIVRVRKQ